MMKKSLLLLVFGAMLFSASAQYTKRVLVEEFTNASCPPCASQNPAFNALLQANASKVTAIKYQTSWPGTDPMNAQNPSEVTTRVNYYGVSGVPTGLVNGTVIANDCNGYDGAPACLSAAEINAAYGQTPVNITVGFTLNAAFDSMFITASVLSDVALTGDYRLYIGVIEEVINFNAAPGTNGEKEFFQPMRKMFPNAEGNAAGNFAAGETKSYNFAWKIPAHIYNENQLGLVAFLQNYTTQEVMQSAYQEPASPKIGIPSGISIVCESGSSPSVTITNQADEALTSASFKYRLGTNPWEDYAWTGNLAPGASTVITLSNIVITQSGNNLVDILPISSNNGAIQTNILAGYSTLTIKALFDAPAALPVATPFQSAAFPPTGWLLKNEGTNGWKIATNAGGSGSTRSAKNNMYDYPNGTTELQSPKIDLTQSSGTTTLTFDHAYTYYETATELFFDSLRVEITGDCGATWTTLLHDGYEGLATAPATSGSFTPTAAQWRANTFDISSYNGQEIMLRFTGETGFGNNAYVDNVNITTAVGVKNLDLSSFTLSPNPTRDIAELRFGLDKAQNIQLNVFNALGVLVQSQDLGQLSSGDHAVSLEAAKLNSGSYRVVLQGSEGVAQTQWIVVK